MELRNLPCWGWTRSEGRPLAYHCNCLRFSDILWGIDSVIFSKSLYEQCKSEGFDSCDWPSNLTQIGFKSLIFHPCDLEIWWMTSKNNRTPLLYYIKFCASFEIHRWIQTGITVRKRSIRVKIGDFCPVWPWNPMDDMGNNRAPLLHCIKLCASFQSHGWTLSSGQNRWFFWFRVTLKFEWPWKKIGHLFCVASSFVQHHFIAISVFKLELQTWNAKFGWKSMVFVPCDIEIWHMTLKNNRAPLLCYFKLCAPFRSHWWIKTGVAVWKCLIWVKINVFFLEPCDLEIWWMTLKNNRLPKSFQPVRGLYAF